MKYALESQEPKLQNQINKNTKNNTLQAKGTWNKSYILIAVSKKRYSTV